MNELPLVYQEPSDEFISTISSLMRKLPVVSEDLLFEIIGPGEKQSACRGSHQEALAALKDALASDYENNMEATEGAPWTFEYVLRQNPYLPEGSDVQGLCVHTRLYGGNPEEKGGIYYGPKIFRISDDRYLYWLEEATV